MIYTGSDELLYDTIRSLNVLNENRSFESSLFTYFTYYDGRERNVADSKERYDKSKELANFLLNGYDRFLRIKINPMPNHRDMEFQFWLFDVSESNWSAGSVDFKVPDLVGYASASALLSLDRDDHEQRLIYALKKVNPEANSVPHIALFHNRKTIRNGQELYVHVGDTVRIYSSVIDRDSEEKTIRYHWFTDSPANIKNFREEAADQAIILTSTDATEISLIVTDGICQSESYSITLHPINLPQLYLVKQKTGGSSSLLSSNGDQTTPAINIRYSRFNGIPRLLYNEPVHMSMSMFDQRQEVFLQNHQEAETAFKLVSGGNGEASNDFSILSYHHAQGEQQALTRGNYSFKLEQRFTEGQPVELLVSPALNQVPSGSYSFLVSPSYQNIRGGSQLFRVNITEVKRYYWSLSPYLLYASESFRKVYSALDVGFGYQWIPRLLTTNVGVGVRDTGHFRWSTEMNFTPIKFKKNIDVGLSISYQAFQLGDLHYISALPDAGLSRSEEDFGVILDYYYYRNYVYDSAKTERWEGEWYYAYESKIDTFEVADRYPLNEADLFESYVKYLFDHSQEEFAYYDSYNRFIPANQFIHSFGIGLIIRTVNRKNSTFIDYFLKMSRISWRGLHKAYRADISKAWDTILHEQDQAYDIIYGMLEASAAIDEEKLNETLDQLQLNYEKDQLLYDGFLWSSNAKSWSIQFEIGASFNFHFKKT